MLAKKINKIVILFYIKLNELKNVLVYQKTYFQDDIINIYFIIYILEAQL